MRHQIAVVTTEYLRRHVERCLSRLQLDGTFQVLCYQPFNDIDSVYRQIPPDAAGILCLGKIFAEAIRHDHPEDQRVLRSFGVDDAAVHRLLWQIQEERGGLNLSRIYTDFLELLHMDIHEFLVHDHAVTLSDAVSNESRSYTTGALGEIGGNQYQKLVTIWETGQFDLILTRHSELIPLLREKRVQVYYPYPSMDSVRRACTELLHQLEIQQLQAHQAAEIYLNLWVSDPSNAVDDRFERRCVILQEALMGFFSDASLEHVIRRSHFGLDILTDRRTVAYCTQNYTACLLSEYLKQRVDFKVYVGYGLGKSIYQARLNAINATREAEMSGGSYLINEKDELIGPLGAASQLTVPTGATFAYPSGRSGLSSLTISKVMAALSNMPEQQITARELALKLSISHRSANHFLTGMTNAGLLQVVAERRTTTRGRPERVYGRPAAQAQATKK